MSVAPTLSVAPLASAAPEYADLPQANYPQNAPTWISGDGRYIVMGSNLTLLPDGLYGGWFIRDRQTQHTTRITGIPNGNSTVNALTDDLRYVVLTTTEPLLPQDTNSANDVYVLDRDNNIYELISRSSSGTISNGISAAQNGNGVVTSNGRYVVFESSATNLDSGTDDNVASNGGWDFFIHDRMLNTTKRLSSNPEGNAGNSNSPVGTISANGEIAIFDTFATSISGAPDSSEQVIAVQLSTGLKTRISIPQDMPDVTVGCDGRAISADGRYIVIGCQAPMLKNYYTYNGDQDPNGTPFLLYRYDRISGELRIVNYPNDGMPLTDDSRSTDISSDGQRISFYSNFNGYYWDASRGTAIKFSDTMLQGPIMSLDGLTVTAQEIGWPGSRTGVWALPAYETTSEDHTIPTIEPDLSNSGILAWSVDDAESAIAATHGCDTVDISTTARQSYTCIAASAGGVAVKTITAGDNTPPIITVHTSAAPNANGWNNGPIDLSWDVSDPDTDIIDTDGCSSATIVATETRTCTATSGGGTSSQSVTIKLDSSAPTLSTPAWSQNPKPTTGSTSLSVPATDDTSGIQKAEYFIGDNDPGQGNGATMQLANLSGDAKSATLSTTFGTDFPTGVYKISVRAEDKAGNWSLPTSDYLVVYNPSGLKMTGKRTVVPSLANSDILPGLIANDQTDKAKFGFSVKYTNLGQIDGNSDLMFSYSTGTHCNNAKKAVNCHDMSIDATSISWLTTQGDNNSTGIFQGIGNMVVDGQTSQVLFRITGIDGERLSPVATDQFQLQVFEQGANPSSSQPLYRINVTDITRGNIKITAPTTPVTPPSGPVS